MKLVHGAVSIGIIAAVLFGLPAVIKPRWNDLLALFGEKEIVQFALSVTVAHLSMLVFANGFFGLCYAGIIPILRNYKIHPDRWPWESGDAEKRAAFWKLLRKAILLTLFNNIVIAIVSRGKRQFSQPCRILGCSAPRIMAHQRRRRPRNASCCRMHRRPLRSRRRSATSTWPRSWACRRSCRTSRTR